MGSWSRRQGLEELKHHGTNQRRSPNMTLKQSSPALEPETVTLKFRHLRGSEGHLHAASLIDSGHACIPGFQSDGEADFDVRQ